MTGPLAARALMWRAQRWSLFKRHRRTRSRRSRRRCGSRPTTPRRARPAIAHLQEAAKQQYFNPHAGHELAIAYHRAGEHDKAVAEQKRVDGYDPKMGAQIAHDIGLR